MTRRKDQSRCRGAGADRQPENDGTVNERVPIQRIPLSTLVRVTHSAGTGRRRANTGSVLPLPGYMDILNVAFTTVSFTSRKLALTRIPPSFTQSWLCRHKANSLGYLSHLTTLHPESAGVESIVELPLKGNDFDPFNVLCIAVLYACVTLYSGGRALGEELSSAYQALIELGWDLDCALS